MPAPAAFGFGTPFAEQLEFFRQKLNLPSERWDDITRSAHDRAFIVAGAMKADLIADLRAAMDRRIEDGKGLEAFRKEFRAIVQKHGWTGWTGEGSKRGEAWRTRVIYQTNMATSYAAGRWRQLNSPTLVSVRPFWRYVHADGVMHPRPKHKQWGDMKLTLRHDHPFWKTHFPPNGWGCHCRVTAVRGPEPGDATTPPDDWQEIDAKTGAPVGIDKGFDYAPGANVHQALRDLIDAKRLKLPPDLVQALEADAAKVLGAAPVPVASPPAAAPVAPAFVPTKTARAAAKWAMDNNLADFADYKGIHPEVANEWNRSLFEHLQEFPALRGNQKFVGSCQAQFARYAEVRRAAYVQQLVAGGVPQTAAEKWAEKAIRKPKVSGDRYAQSWSQPEAQGISVNAKWGGDPAPFRAALSRDVVNGWHPPGTDTIRSVADHEFGHQLDDLLGLSLDSDVIQAHKEAIAKGLKHEVSGYAAHKHKPIAEFIAECWAESCNSATPRDAARTVAAIVRARYRSRFAP